MSAANHHNTQNWILLSLLTLIWGSSYILIKKSLLGFSAFEVACLRVTISGFVSLPFAVRGWKNLPAEKRFTLLQVGFFGSGAPAFLFALSMTKSGSALNGILNSLSPLWTLLIGYYLFNVAIDKYKVLGVIIGFAGAVVLVLGKGSGLEGDVLYSFLPVVATFCYGMSTNITKQKLQDQNPIYTTAIALCMVSVPAALGLMFTQAPSKILEGHVWGSLLDVVILSVLGTFVAWMLFYRLVQRTDALFAASVTYLIPVVALMWGFADGEWLSIIQLAGLTLILAGVALVTRVRSNNR